LWNLSHAFSIVYEVRDDQSEPANQERSS